MLARRSNVAQLWVQQPAHAGVSTPCVSQKAAMLLSQVSQLGPHIMAVVFWGRKVHAGALKQQTIKRCRRSRCAALPVSPTGNSSCKHMGVCVETCTVYYYGGSWGIHPVGNWWARRGNSSTCLFLRCMEQRSASK